MAEIKIGKITMGMVGTNCYFLYREGSTEVIFIDPADHGKYLYDALKSKEFHVGAILLTHGHFDHIWGCSELRQCSGAKVYALDAEEDLLQSSTLNSSASAGRPCTVKANEFFHDGQEVTLCDMTFQVLATPGHTKGSCCYYFAEAGILISGDTLFAESVGRTDLPTGSMGELNRSIREKLSKLPDDTKVYPGHGDFTTIGHERQYNPFWNEG